MRYPEEKSDSQTNLSNSDNYRLPSSSSTSQVSQDVEEDQSGGEPNNIATISEHVLFENNNGHNSFLYLYYSSSNNNADFRRPYTTEGGGGEALQKKRAKMGSNQPWNDLSGGLRPLLGSGPPSPLPYPEDKVNQVNLERGNKKGKDSGERRVTAEVTPYPFYMSPVEGGPLLADSPTEKAEKVPSVAGSGRERLDSFTADLLEEEWDRIYSVPASSNSRYLLSPEPAAALNRLDNGPTSATDTGQRPSKENAYMLSVSKLSVTSDSASSSSRARLGSSSQQSFNNGSKSGGSSSSRGVRVNPGASSASTAPRRSDSMKKLGSRSSSRSNKLSSSTRSSGARRCNGEPPNAVAHGVTHHHHDPPGPGGGTLMRGSSNTTGDGLDLMSFRNGIGAYFGTPASRQYSQKRELSPEEMYQQEMQGWRSRLATGATIFTATLFILSCSSLLFVFPIIVDPILVGFEAQFSSESVTCRTTNFRNGTGPGECAIPSCREGCTLDLFSCIFVEVEYTIPHETHSRNMSAASLSTRNDSTELTLTSNETTRNLSQQLSSSRKATLLININGCGYPPDVTCSDFERKYAPLNTSFACYYSQQNESIVVPQYSRRTQIIHLSLAVCIPIGTALFSGISLYLLLRYQVSLKGSIYRKYAARKKALHEERKNSKMLRNGEDAEPGEEDVTSISELDPQTPEENGPLKNHKFMNGASRSGLESNSMLLNSTQM